MSLNLVPEFFPSQIAPGIASVCYVTDACMGWGGTPPPSELFFLTAL